MEEVVKALDEAINYIDKLESVLSRLRPGEQLTPGALYQIYELLMLTREKVVEARLKALAPQ
ncbi:MAG: hypothetical protein ACP5KA_00145 [Desulfurococcaceae archaeon]